MNTRQGLKFKKIRREGRASQTLRFDYKTLFVKRASVYTGEAK